MIILRLVLRFTFRPTELELPVLTTIYPASVSGLNNGLAPITNIIEFELHDYANTCIANRVQEENLR